MSRKQRPEQALQMACVDFLRRCCPPPPEGPWFTHPANGFYRTKAEAGIARAMGVRAGAPDLLLIFRGRCIAIEMKSEKGRISMDQLGCHAELRLCGATVWSDIRSLDAFVEALRVMDVPIRGRIAA